MKKVRSYDGKIIRSYALTFMYSFTTTVKLSNRKSVKLKKMAVVAERREEPVVRHQDVVAELKRNGYLSN